jgi:arylformamidase
MKLDGRGSLSGDPDPFRIRSHVPAFDDLVREFAERSASTRARLRMAEIAYGDDPSETLDLFFPDGAAANRPVHMFVHGGYWRMFSKRDFSYVADTVTNAGAIAAIVDYALMPAVRMATVVEQVGRAARWLGENIGSHGGDAENITVSGHSAGAHLCTFLFEEGRASSVRSALLLGGLYDLKPLQSSFLKDEIALTDDEVGRFSPLTRRHRPDVAVSVLVGERETAPFHEQAASFAVRLAGQGLAVSSRTLPGADHMSAVRDLGLPESEAGRALMALVEGAV